MRAMPTFARGCGFTLVEVLVALIIISVGLLGVASMQALALASSTSARMRTLAAIEAASLASTMHADQVFWSGPNSPASVVIAGSSIATDTSGLLGGTYKQCDSATNGAPCTTSQIAQLDTQRWAASLAGVLPNPTTTITCDKVNAPLTCTIVITWTESTVNINQQKTLPSGSGSLAAPQYTLYVQP